MPTYAYVCKHCGHALEVFQSIKEDPLKRCPECRKHGLERQIGAGAGILFKGSGFYETDYRSDSYKSAAKKDSDSGSKPKSSESKSSESKSSSGDSPSSDSKSSD